MINDAALFFLSVKYLSAALLSATSSRFTTALSTVRGAIIGGGFSSRHAISQQSSASRIDVIFAFQGPYDSLSFRTIYLPRSPELDALIPHVDMDSDIYKSTVEILTQLYSLTAIGIIHMSYSLLNSVTGLLISVSK